MAHRLRDKIEGVLNTDRTVRLVVQLEAALHDSRFEVSSFMLLTCQVFGQHSGQPPIVPAGVVCLAPRRKGVRCKFGIPHVQEAAILRDELAREYDMRAQAAVREKQQLDL